MLAYESIFVHEGQKTTRTIHRIAFFAGQDVLVTEAELHAQDRKWPGPIPRSRGVRLEFRDGYSLDGFGVPEYVWGKWSTCLHFPHYTGMKDFIIDLQKIVVRVFPSEMDVSTSGVGCDPNSQPTTFRTRVRFVHLSSNQDYILSDGTFLTVLDDDFIVRFDRALHSPFIDQHPDLFLVDFAQVEPILAEATRREKEEPGFNPLQFIHDRVAELVTAMPKPTPR